MPRLLIFPALLLLLSLAGFVRAAEDAPPENIAKHYDWCLLPKYLPNAIARTEGFWKKYHSKDETYPDATHLRYVRRSAYRLAGLYVADGQKEKCRDMLRWLEAHDNTLPRR